MNTQFNSNVIWLQLEYKISTLSVYSYNSIKRICSIKRPGLEFFKKILLNVPYYHKTACT